MEGNKLMDELQQDAAPEQIAPDQPAHEDAPATEAPTEERFTDLNPDEKPEGEITNEWLQERYKQMQADYTRKRQADAETAKQRAEELQFLESLRSDRDVQQAVFEQLQEILSDEEIEELLEDEGSDEQSSELERQVQELRQIEEQRQAQHLASQVVSHLKQLASDAGIEMDDQDMSEAFDAAIAGEAVDNATTEAAFKAFTERRKGLQDKWLKDYLASKQAPSQVPAGSPGTEKPNLSDRDTRLARMAAIMSGGS